MQGMSGALPLAAVAALEESGFVVIPGPFAVEQLGAVVSAYDAEVGAAVRDDIGVGSTSPASWTSSIAARCSIRCTCIRRYLLPRLGPSA